MIPSIILDFDGTLTDTSKEAETFYDAYIYRLAEILTINKYELEQLMALGRAEILAKPGKHGWEIDEVIVAPATADPYLFTQATAVFVLRNLLRGTKVPPESDWVNLFNELFSYAYPKAGTYFRSYAFDCVKRLNKWSKLTIVTNSSTENVLRKIEKLVGSTQQIKVLGNAKKYELDPSWKEMPESITPYGFPRPVYLRRKSYANVIESVGEVDSVCGDVWELDLALPEKLGIYTALVTSEFTPIWEKRHYDYFENGMASESLEQITDYLLTA